MMKTARITVLIMFYLAVASTDSMAVLECDGIPVPVSLKASPSSLPVLSSNTTQLVFKLESPVANDTHLTLRYTGTVQNGVDVYSLPTSVLIPALNVSAILTVKAKTNYPFSTKTLTVAITNSDNACVVLGSPSTATLTLTGFAPPSLNLSQLSSTNVLLSWWAPVPGYVLQCAKPLVSTSWLTQTNAPAGIQGTNGVILTWTTPTAFYRLMKP
jgi:hypothetical protein